MRVRWDLEKYKREQDRWNSLYDQDGNEKVGLSAFYDDLEYGWESIDEYFAMSTGYINDQDVKNYEAPGYKIVKNRK